ncbi:MAG: c-type cytochrome [Vicinamibacterales bacterium]
MNQLVAQAFRPRVVLLSAIFALASFGVKASGPAPGAVQMSKADMVKRGDYLVNTMGCTDCHTPFKMGPNGPEPDMDRFLSGHPASEKLPPPPPPSGPWIVTISSTFTAYAGPWGISYTQNLTPDLETGIAGTYTEEQFIMTIREGKKQGRGRAILPPMPWPVIRNLTDDDLKSIYAYLKTVKPVKNRVPDPVIAEMK